MTRKERRAANKAEKARVKRVKKIGKLKLRLNRFKAQERAKGRKQLLIEQRALKKQEEKILKDCHNGDYANMESNVKDMLEKSHHFYNKLIDTQKNNFESMIDKKEEDKQEVLDEYEVKVNRLNNNQKEILQAAHTLEKMQSIIINDISGYGNDFQELIQRVTKLQARGERVKANQAKTRAFIAMIEAGQYEKAKKVKLRQGQIEFY